jgi:PAS domain S-box-containing protein
VGDDASLRSAVPPPAGPGFAGGQIELETLLEAIPDATVIIDGRGVVRLLNARAERLFGWEREDLVGRPVEMLVPERFRAGHPDHRAGYLSDPDVRDAGARRELLALRRDGSELPVEISLSPLRTAGGTLVLGTIRDVSDRRRAEEKFRGLLEAAPDAMVIVDAKGEIVLVNTQAEQLFGYRREEMLGRPVELLIPSRFRGRHEDHRAAYAGEPRSRGMGVGLELFGQRKDGSEFSVEVSLSPLVTAEGLLVSAAVRDISARKRADAELAERAAELARSNADLEQFAYVASHDLQEPLRVVASFTQLLARRYKGKLDADADEFIRYAVDGVERMRALILDLLAYSRVSRHGKPFQRVSMEAVLGEALGNLRQAVRETSAEVTHDPLPEVVGDSIQLVQLLQNLVGNAIKFHGATAPCVHVSAAPENVFWRFSVSDNGIGIDPKYFERIFVIFQRLHTRDRYPGTGIGLAICKKIVERHGGRIWVESGPSGSTFHFTLHAAARRPPAS